ncbi:hypothetical protein D6829_00060 [Candidatus Pacearchaeota archaeon]|nr:MAG: hypothetical protein D6829_00060 [Candidatus Pacearchaeota archaeon]
MGSHLYVMSDTHDDLEATSRAVDFAESEGFENSAIIHVGDFLLRPYERQSLESLVIDRDIGRFISEKRKTSQRKLKGYQDIFENSQIPYLVIPGNYDGDLGGVFGENDIHNKKSGFNGIRIVGYGGGGNLDEPWVGPPHIKLLVNLREITLFDKDSLLKLLEDNNPQIAVIHNPPYGFCDDMFNGQHVGTPTTTRYMQENNNLKLVLSGHIHEAGPNGNNPNGVRGISGIKREDGSKVIVVNPGNLGRFELMNPRTLEPTIKFDYGTFARVDIEEDGTPVMVTQYSVKEGKRAIGDVRQIGCYGLTD